MEDSAPRGLLRSVADLVKTHAAAWGPRAAFHDRQRAVTYRELLDRTARLAGHLAEIGVARGDRVALVMSNRVEMMESYVAVARAGAVGVPLSPMTVDPELQELLEDFAPRAAIVDASQLDKVSRVAAAARLGLRMIAVGEAASSPSALRYELLAGTEPGAPPRDDLALDEIAWILYTSGTTGRAKGVLLTQGACLRAAAVTADVFALSADDRVLWPLPLFHSYAHCVCLLSVLTAGASAHLATATDPAELLRTIEAAAPTVLAAVPALYHHLVAAASPPVQARTMRLCISAGSRMPDPLRLAVAERFQAPVRDLYGSTETCGPIAVGVEARADPWLRPVPGVELCVVDPSTGEALGTGVQAEGEVWVRGPHLMAGYHEQPAAATTMTRGWYRTGDLARRDARGWLMITGRLRDLINRAGEKFSPGEVEEVLLQAPAVADAAVVGAPDEILGEVPVGYVVATATGELDAARILELLRRRLSYFKVPVRLFEVDRIPRTPSGKVLRHRIAELPARPLGSQPRPVQEPVQEPAQSGALGASATCETSRALELVLDATAALLGHAGASQVAADRGFFELGIDSMRALELRDRLARATGLLLPTTVVFDHPSPAALARYLEGTAPLDAREIAPALEAVEPIAIIGMACRYPGGVGSADELWELLESRRDAISAFPTNRGWDIAALYDPDPARPGTTYVRAGGFLHDADQFDAGFFGISPREALAMDPQQRIILEVAWEALEHAGIDPVTLRGRQAGVFAGVMGCDYRPVRIPEAVEGISGIATATSVLSGRIAYVLGLHGPAISVDTACSSSLVAIHLACQSLRRRECSLALAGGVTVMSTASAFTEFSRQRALAPDGRCKAFSDAADGTSWSEGAGVLVLERVEEAMRNGHRILAVIRGSAVNQDGASSGLTVPSGEAQRRLIRQALASAGLTSDDVDAVEAHATGTSLGDPIEAAAIAATYGQARAARWPLWLGSLKSNLGHAQAAAGVGGVIKMVEALRRGSLPATLHVGAPSRHVDWSAGDVRLLTDAVPWPERVRPRRAGVSAFGISGTNAHLVLEQAPPVPDAPQIDAPERAAPWPLSAKSTGALAAQARRLHAHVSERRELRAVDVGGALALRTAFAHRAVVLGRDRDELLAHLAALGPGDDGAGVVRGVAAGGKTAFLFTGQGAQRPGMGGALRQRFAVYRAAFDEVCAALDEHLGAHLHDVVFGDDAGALDQTVYTQAATFALEVALFRLLESWGLRADILAGHSIGELAAAHVAGVWDLQDAAALVAARGALLQRLPPGGAMLAVRASAAELADGLADHRDRVAIAAINGPRSTVVSGEVEALERLAAHWRAAGHDVRRLRVSHAFHSPLVEPMLGDFLRVAQRVRYAVPERTIASAVTGAIATPAQLCDPAYWAAQIREPVRFRASIAALGDEAVRRFVELGPDRVLAALVPTILEGRDALSVSTLRHDHDEIATLVTAVGELHARGAAVDWSAACAATAGSAPRRVDLPPYAFEHQRYWLSATEPAHEPAAMAAAAHPFLASQVWLADGGVVFTGHVSVDQHPWLADHVIGDAIVVPGAALVEMALWAGAAACAPAVGELVQHTALSLGPGERAELQLRVDPVDPAGRRPFTIDARIDETIESATGRGAFVRSWARHASGWLGEVRPAEAATPGPWPPPGAESIAVESLYAACAAHGLTYGPSFRGVAAAWRTDTAVLAEIVPPSEIAGAPSGVGLHPAVLDAALHAAILLGGSDPGPPLLPFAWRAVQLHAGGASTLRVRITAPAPGSLAVALADAAGEPVGTVEELVLRPAAVEQLQADAGAARDATWQVVWRLVPGVRSAQPPRVAVLGDGDLGLAAPRIADPGELNAVPDILLVPCGSSSPSDVVAGVHGEVVRVLTILQAWIARPRPPSARLLLVTRGAVAIRDDEEPRDLIGAAVWGLARSAQAEHPGAIIALDIADPSRLRDRLAAVIACGESQLALREDALWMPRIARLAIAGVPDAWPGGGTVLITGASGALGGLIAQHLVAVHGARHLVLASRRPIAPELTHALVAAGAELHVAACDVSDRDAVAALLAQIPAAHPLVAVVHAAGVLDDGVVSSLTPERVHAVLRPKVDAAMHLHELTAGMPLRELILFSSVAGVLGTPGQASYAAASAFLDALARHRRAHGLPARSLVWGPWTQIGGMAERLADVHARRLARSELVPLRPEVGLAVFDAARAHGQAVTLAQRWNIARLRELADAGALPLMLRELVPTPARRAPPPPSARGSLRERLAAHPAAEHREIAEAFVRTEVASVLGYASNADVPASRSLHELGLDSLTSLQLVERLRRASGLELTSGAVFAHPTPAALAAMLLDQLQPASAEPPAAPGARAAPSTGMVELLRAGVAAGQLREAFEFLAAGARLRTRFRSGEASTPARAVALARGAAPPALICIPSISAASGPHEYTRLAAALRGERHIAAVPNPGFLAGERLPHSFGDLLDSHVEAVAACADGHPFALLGRSAGGLIAHAVASRLEAIGTAPAAVLLLDTYPAVDDVRMLRIMIEGLTREADPLLDDQRLTATGAYLFLLHGCAPRPLAAPTLLVRARDRLATFADLGAASWPLPHDEVDADGDHFTMLTDHAAATARIVHAWLLDAIAAPTQPPGHPPGSPAPADAEDRR